MHLTQAVKENILKLAHKAKPTVCCMHKLKLKQDSGESWENKELNKGKCKENRKQDCDCVPDKINSGKTDKTRRKLFRGKGHSSQEKIRQKLSATFLK